MVDKHILVCPATKKQRLQEQQPFYKHNLNTGGHGKDCSLQQNLGSISLVDATKLALSVLRVHQKLFQHNVAKEPTQLSFQDIVSALPLFDLSRDEIEAGLATAESEYRIKSGGPRHLHQQASLVGHLRRIGALEKLGSTEKTCTNNRIVLEVGAGRGMTGLVVSAISAATGVSTKLIMVEKAGSRAKADTVLRNLPKENKTLSYPFDLQSIDWERLQCDLAHVDMASVLRKDGLVDGSQGAVGTSKSQVIVVAKHLCGVGTDLALKSLEPVRDKISACIFATCCHGACSWSGYVGRDYLCAAMETESDTTFSEPEFELLRKWASAGCIVDGPETVSSVQPANERNQDDEHGSQTATLNNDDREPVSIGNVVDALGLKCGAHGLGRCCQRLIDYGRREYLNHVLFAGESERAELVYYVPLTVTPQNAALFAFRQHSPPTDI